MTEAICNAMIYGGIALAIVFAALAVIIFIREEIPKVIGELTGSTAKKAIEEINEKGYEGAKNSDSSRKNANRAPAKTNMGSGRMTIRDVDNSMTSDEKYNTKKQKLVEEAVKMAQQNIGADEEATGLLEDEMATDVLDNYNVTEDDMATDVLSNYNGEDYDEEPETDVLVGGDPLAGYDLGDDDEPETDVLRGYDIPAQEEDLATDVLVSQDDPLAGYDLDEDDDEDGTGTTDILTSFHAPEPEESGTTETLTTPDDEDKDYSYIFGTIYDAIEIHTAEEI